MNAFNSSLISGVYPVTSTNTASYTQIDNSVFKVRFIKSESSANPFVSAKFCIMTAEEVKIFVGLFAKEDNTEVALIQVPLLGQSINDLIRVINTYSEVFAEAVESGGFVSTLILEDTKLINGGSNWVYFQTSSTVKNVQYSSLNKNIKFILTSAEALSEQKNLTQSLGGYVSLSEVYSSVQIASSLSIYETSVYIDPGSITGEYTLSQLQLNTYLQVNDEIIKISKWQEYVGYISERNVFDTPLRFHPKGSTIRGVISNSFFDKTFNKDGKQYRCLAIKNSNIADSAKDLKVYFKFPSRNNLSGLRLAIETPKNDYYLGTASSSGLTAFTVTGLVGAFDEDHFALSPIKFTNGLNINQTRFVKSYNPTSGTIILDSRLPYSISYGDSFFIDTAPSQRIKTGTISPLNLDFYNANDEDNAISINVSNNRISGNDLLPNEVIYLWIERSISESNDEYIGNRSVIELIYSKV